MTRKLIAIAAGACLLLSAGCASLATGYVHTQNDLADQSAAQRAGFTFTAFDAEVGGPSVSADVGQVIGNLYQNHLPSMAIANVADIALGYMTYSYGKRSGWWGDNGDSKAPLTMEAPAVPTSARDIYYVQGNGNSFDASTGHNSTDNSAKGDSALESSGAP